MKATYLKMGVVLSLTIVFVTIGSLAGDAARSEGILPNGSLEEDTIGTSFDDITDWDHVMIVHNGNPPVEYLEIVGDYYYEGQQSLYSYVQTYDLTIGDAVVSQYFETEQPLSTTADYITLWLSGAGYNTSSRYYWRVVLVLTDGTVTHEYILRCDCWGLNEGCNPNHYDYYDATKTGADGKTWNRYTRSIPGDLDKSNLTVKIRHRQASWDGTQADSWYRLDYIYFSDADGNALTPPRITSITDVENDQGRQVSVSWERALYDAPGDSISITGYSLWRRIDELPSTTQSQRASAVDLLPRLSYPPGDWHYVLTVPARGETEYHCVAPTLCDSTITNGMCYSTFFVSAMTPDPLLYYDSVPDSGYSVDNLAPSVPTGFALACNTGSGNQLTWDECPDGDFGRFNIYRSTDPNFVPSPLNLVHATTGTSWTDPDFDGWNVHYKITALDHAGNEGAAGSPTTATAISPTVVPATFALYPNVPNPFNPSTSIRYDVPAGGGAVTLRIYDVAGRLVRTLVDSDRSTPGTHTAMWNGTDERGKEVATGIYFYRLTGGGFGETRKMVLLK